MKLKTAATLRLSWRYVCRTYCNSSSTPLIRRKPTGQSKQESTFVDRRVLTVVGGNGGDGCISFSRLFGNEFAGPDGGDGGNGGHVMFKACSSVKSLAKIPSIITGENGVHGSTCNCAGANGEDYVVQVPIGTLFRAHDDQNDKKLEADLNTEDALFLAARGGYGGKGNKFFASASNQSPEIAEYGTKGETRKYLVELSMIAHFGFIGFPNAGKSTLLRAISRARPKVAPYPFTTLKPHLGEVVYSDFETITVADIPGIIRGAHKNRGLGYQFLRHIRRCFSLIYVIDFTVENPVTQLEELREELCHYDENLVNAHSVYVANKMDTPEAQANFKVFNQQGGYNFIPISGKQGTNVKKFLMTLKNIFEDHKSKMKPEKSIEKYEPVRHNSNVRSWR